MPVCLCTEAKLLFEALRVNRMSRGYDDNSRGDRRRYLLAPTPDPAPWLTQLLFLAALMEIAALTVAVGAPTVVAAAATAVVAAGAAAREWVLAGGCRM